MYVTSPDLLTGFKTKNSQFTDENTGTRREENSKNFVEQNKNQNCSNIRRGSTALNPLLTLLMTKCSHLSGESSGLCLATVYWILFGSDCWYGAMFLGAYAISQFLKGKLVISTLALTWSWFLIVLYNIIDNFVCFVDSNVLNVWTFWK